MANILEQSLEKAVNDPDVRRDFYQLLMRETLYMPVNSVIPEGATVFSKHGEKDYTWAVANINGVVTVPAFTSQENADHFFQNVTGWEGRTITIIGNDLMSRLGNTEFLSLEINPMSQNGVSLPPGMIKELLAFGDKL